MALKVFLILLVLCSHGYSYQDLTLEERAKGADVVQAVISKFDKIFSSTLYKGNQLWRNTGEYFDNTFVRNLAYIESLDGTDTDTYRNGYFGGIWQVDEDRFLATKDMGLSVHHQTIHSVFGFEWKQVEWLNLTRPLYSALAAKLYLIQNSDNETRNKNVSLCSEGPPSSISEQAEYWNECYQDGRGEERDFISLVTNLNQNQEACRVDADLVFVLDSSGSINHANSTNWDRVKQFVERFTRELRFGSNSKDHVGVITFGLTATININLNHTHDSTSLSNAIFSLPYLNERTNTADGLCKLTQLEWRPNVLRVALVVTDGRSNERSSQQCGRTERAAMLVHTTEPEILVYVIGVTDRVRDAELAIIASSPEYVDHLDSFDEEELNFARQHQTYRICFTASTLISAGNQTIHRQNFTRDEQARFHYNVTEGMTIRLCVPNGNVILFASTDISNPNEAYNDFVLQPSLITGATCADEYVDIVSLLSTHQRSPVSEAVVNDTVSVTLYVSIEGKRENSSFTLTSFTGDLTENTVSCNHNRCGINAICTDEPIGYSCNCLQGFEGDALLECSDINECERAPIPCHESAKCTNIAGGYKCECDLSYEGNGRTCQVHREWIISVSVGAVGGLLLLLAIIVMGGYTIYCSLKRTDRFGTLV